MEKVSKININDFFQAAAIISIISGLLILNGYLFYMSFFNRLSIPYAALFGILPFEYMFKGLFPIILYSFFILLFIKIKDGKFKLFIENLAILIIFTLFLLFGIKSIIFSSIVFIVGFYIIYKFTSTKKSIFRDKILQSSWNRVLFLLMLIVLMVSITETFGFSSAEFYITGNHPDALEPQIFLKDKTNTQLQNKSLILITFIEGNYYFVERNESVPKYPNIYIIPNDQIEMLTIFERGNRGKMMPLSSLISTIPRVISYE